MSDQDTNTARERWPATRPPQVARRRPLLWFWAAMLAVIAGGAGVLQALGPPAEKPLVAEKRPVAEKRIAVTAPEPAPQPASPPASEPQAPAPLAPAALPPATAAAAAPTPPAPVDHQLARRAGPPHRASLARRHRPSDARELALERLRREQDVPIPQVPDEAAAAAGQGPGYADLDAWRRLAPRPWPYGPPDAQAYGGSYPYWR